MTPLQNLWLTILNFGPAVILAIYKHWWVGLLAIATTFLLSWALTFLVTTRVSADKFTLWAWTKPVLVAAAVLVVGWRLF